jgi:hypothetical protein
MTRGLRIPLVIATIAVPVWLHFDSSPNEHLIWCRTPKAHSAVTFLVSNGRIAFYFDHELPPPRLLVKYERAPVDIISGYAAHRWIPPGSAVATTPVILLALPGLLLLGETLYRQYQRRRAARAGCCRKCGYDLRATPLRCPECGTHVNPVAV